MLAAYLSHVSARAAVRLTQKSNGKDRTAHSQEHQHPARLTRIKAVLSEFNLGSQHGRSRGSGSRGGLLVSWNGRGRGSSSIDSRGGSGCRIRSTRERLRVNKAHAIDRLAAPPSTHFRSEELTDPRVPIAFVDHGAVLLDSRNVASRAQPQMLPHFRGHRSVLGQQTRENVATLSRTSRLNDLLDAFR